MPARNENIKISCRYLSARDFAALHETFLAAFADYVVPFQLSEKQLENHLAQNAVDLRQSIGAFCGEKMVAFTLNGFGAWNGKQTAYDAGTGVAPPFRRRGLAKAMFDFMLPRMRETGVGQMLLEVITKNEKAVGLYRQIGFEETRKLGFFEQSAKFKFVSRGESKIEVREIANPDWQALRMFWDAETSWQNSIEAVERSFAAKIFSGAYVENRCVGYAIANRNSATIAQLAVDKNFRRKGVASRLLAAMRASIEAGRKIRVSNVDYALENARAFLKSAGFEEILSQFEMIKTL